MIRSLLAVPIARGLSVLRSDVRDGVARNAGHLLLGHLVRLSLGLLGSVLVARALGPERLGTFAVATAAVLIAATVADAGLTSGAIRQISARLTTSAEEARRTAGTYARLRLLAAALVCAAALTLARPLAGLLGLAEPAGPLLVRVGAIAVLAAAAYGVTTTILHAQRRFRSLLVAQAVTSAVTVVLLAGLFLLRQLSPATALATGVAASVAGLCIGLRLLPPDWRGALRRGRLRSAEGRTLVAFSRWLWVAAIFSILAAQLDLLLVHRWLEPQVVGLYALAFALALKVDVVNQILHMLLLPAASRLGARDEYVAYGRRSLGRSLVLAIPLLLLLPLARPFITVVYGLEYAPAAEIFQGLLAVVIFDLLTHPLLLLAFPLNLPRSIAAADAARVGVLLACAALLIPLYGVYGAVAAKLAAKVVGAAVIGVPVGLRLRRLDPDRAPAPAAESPPVPASPGAR